jgi:hypothetical protein
VKVLTEGLAHWLRNVEGCRITAHLLVPGSTFTGMTAPQPFQQLQPRLGYVGYGANWNAVRPSDSTICSASLSDRIKGR